MCAMRRWLEGAVYKSAEGRGDRGGVRVDDLVAEIVGRDGLLFELVKVAVELGFGSGENGGRAGVVSLSGRCR